MWGSLFPATRRLLRPFAFALSLLLTAGVARAAEPAKALVWDADAARHLLSRAAFGGSPEEAERLAALPLEKAVDRLLDEAAAIPPPARPSGSVTSGLTAAGAGPT